MKLGFVSAWIFCLMHLTSGHNNMGVLFVEDKASSVSNGSFCLMYNPDFSTLATNLTTAVFHDMGNYSEILLCNDTDVDFDFHNKVIFVKRGNCSFSEKAYLAQQYGAVALVIISANGLHEPVANSDEDYNKINISVSLITDDDFNDIMSLGHLLQVKLYSPPTPSIDFNLLVIWLLATGIVFVGAFLSGIAKHKEYLRRCRALKRVSPAGADNNESPEADDEDTFDMNPTTIIVFVFCMCGMLVSLYFFYDYLVYLVITMFTIASCTSLYFCVKPLWIMIPFFGDCRMPPNKIPGFKRRPEIRLIFLFLLCAAVAVWWAVERNKSYAWILQDILGIFFCIHMMKTVRLPSLMACTVLLGLLFVYDIFFVFITPLFTKGGQSIMVDVATGGASKSGEMLPMVMKVPRITPSALVVCQLPYSLLGFGDILVPGLLISYCHGFDLKVGSKKLYFISSVIAYGVGLVMTFVALIVMNSGQPALLYLVPCTLLTTFIIGACRRELSHLWSGKMKKPVKKNNGNSTPPPEAEEPTNEEQVSDCDEDDSNQPLLINR